MKQFFCKRPFPAAFAILLISLAMTACSSAPQIRTDEDPAANFSGYTTWNFFDPLGIEGGYNSPVYGEHFRAAITREMNNRGYRQSADPDLFINVTFRTDDKVKMRAHTTPYMSGAYYQRPGGPYYGSALGVGVGVSQRATRTTEASVFIDMVDNSTDRMVWQGVAVLEANDKVAKQLRDATYTTVDLVFKQFTHRAGQ